MDGAEAYSVVHRLVTTILDPTAAPAEDLARLHPRRWEIETTFDGLEAHLRGRREVPRSETAALVLQEFHGLLLAYVAVRGRMREFAIGADLDPDRPPFVHAMCVIGRTVTGRVPFPPHPNQHERYLAAVDDLISRASASAALPDRWRTTHRRAPSRFGPHPAGLGA